MEERQYSWASAILPLSRTFLRNINSGMINERQCFVLYTLADCMARYTKHWWMDVFDEETGTRSAEAVGMELFESLNKGLQLIQLCDRKKYPAVVWTILSGPGQFHEVVEHARRYAQMMNRLIVRHLSSSQNPGNKQNLAQQLRHKVEFDCRILQTRIEWAYQQDKIMLLQTLYSPEQGSGSGILPSIFRPFWRDRQVFHDSLISGLISILETGLPQVISSKDLYPREYVGSGAFGRVSKARWCDIPVAIKEFPSESYFNSEFNVFKKFLSMGYSPHIVGIIGCSGKKSIVLEFMDKDLIRLIEEKRTENESSVPFSLDDSIDIMLQIADGMRYLHGLNVTYRDLKPSNVLIQIREDGGFLVKLADFGVSKHNFGTGQENTSNRGTKIYMAPEMMKEGGNYSRKVDIHSFAMVFSEILTGKQPCLETENVMNGKRPQLPRDIPVALHSLIQRCWDEDANTRPSFEEICNELWLIKENLLMPELTTEADPANEKTELKVIIAGLDGLIIESASAVKADWKDQGDGLEDSSNSERIGNNNAIIDGSEVLDTIYSTQSFPKVIPQGEEGEGTFSFFFHKEKKEKVQEEEEGEGTKEEEEGEREHQDPSPTPDVPDAILSSKTELAGLYRRLILHQR